MDADHVAGTDPPRPAGVVRAGWYPDPLGRHEIRFHDGVQWTPYCSDAGEHVLDEVMLAGDGGVVAPPPVPPVAPAAPVRSEQDVAVASVSPPAPASAPASVLELSAWSVGAPDDGPHLRRVLDASGSLVARVVVEGRLLIKPSPWSALRGVGVGRAEVLDPAGHALVVLVPTAPVAKQATVAVRDGAGRPLGRLVEQRGSRPTALGVEVEERFAGYVRGPADALVVEDPAGRVVLRAAPEAGGGRAVRVDDDLAEPLRTLAVVAALTADVLLVHR